MPLPMFILTGTWEKCAEHTAKTMNISMHSREGGRIFAYFFYSILEQCEGKNKITMLNIVCSKLGIVYLTLLEKVQILRREYLF